MTRHERQGFLGPRSEEIIKSIHVGLVGINGGGSHFAQQLSHIGIRHYANFDPGLLDTESNLTRNVNSTLDDFRCKTPKVELARRKITSVLDDDVEIETHACRWQERPDVLGRCDVIFGGVDTFKERNEIEAFARR
jgi:tRNA A37 threonylcarbamoyladenosine dehydratase